MFIKEIKSIEDVRDTLISLCDCDADMSGENGPDYLMDKAKEKGYESNAEYLADEVLKDKNRTVEEYVAAFTALWYSWDRNYYSEMTSEVLKVDIPERNYTGIQGVYAINFMALHEG